MTSGNAAANLGLENESKLERPAAVLRGSSRGLEIVVDGRATTDAVIATAAARLAEAPTFFKGSDVRIRVADGPLPAGSLGRLDELATQFELRIIEIGALGTEKKVIEPSRGNAIPQPNLAAGSAPNAPDLAAGSAPIPPLTTASSSHSLAALALVPPPNEIVMATARALVGALVDPRLSEAMASAQAGVAWASPPAGAEDQLELALAGLEDEPRETRFERAKTAPEFERAKTAPHHLADRADTDVSALVVEAPKPEHKRTFERAKTEEPEIVVVREPETRLFVGPVRSGVILEHPGHLFVFGDVNPGAEVRATGNIVVLGRLRGTAHAGIGAGAGFIVALRLEPQQLRIGRLVARQSDGETATLPEIAYVTDSSIVVERYQGRLPNGLASSLHADR